MTPSTPSNNKPSLHKPEPAAQAQRQWEFEAIGTHFWIGIYQSLDDQIWHQLQRDITGLVTDFDSTWSRFRADSLVTTMSQRAGQYTLPPHGAELLQLYRKLYEASGGQVTPLVGGTLSDLGYDAQYSLQPKPHIRVVPNWDEVLSLQGNVLTVKQPALLDFGAAGKGYLIDLIGHQLEAAGVASYCVDGSGDLRVQGLSPGLRIGIEDPADSSSVVAIAELGNGALCVSAPNRRRWGSSHHIIRPDTSQPTQGIITVAVQAASAGLADGLATALFMVPPQQLQTAYGLDVPFAYLVVYDDYSVANSPGFPAQLFIHNGDA